MRQWFRSFRHDDGGDDMTEYALLLSFIAVMVAIALLSLGTSINQSLSSAGSRIVGATAGGGSAGGGSPGGGTDSGAGSSSGGGGGGSASGGTGGDSGQSGGTEDPDGGAVGNDQ